MRLQATVVGHSLSAPAGASIPHMPTTDGPAFRLATALAIGLLMGAERERRKGEGPQRSPAGIRTFAVAALLGGVSYRLGGGVLLAVTTLALAGFCAVAYWRGYDKDPGLTSETALLLAALLGGLAQVEIAIASGIAVVVTILLAARTPLHHFVRAVLSEQEVIDALIFVAAVLVVLQSIRSEDIDGTDRTTMRAEVITAGPKHDTVEQIVTRLSVEPGIAAVSWSVVPTMME
jgi:uncharacterized membrane protein YhiD involved in acid resistance